MEQSLDMLSKNMVKATMEFTSSYNLQDMIKVKLNRQSSTIEFMVSEGKIRKFSAVFIGVLDKEQDIFYWADALDTFSDYARNTCSECISVLEESMLVESTHHALGVSNEEILEARSLYQDGGRYAIDENDILLSRFSVDELASILFSKTQMKAVFEIPDEEYTYYIGALQALS